MAGQSGNISLQAQKLGRGKQGTNIDTECGNVIVDVTDLVDSIL